MSKLTGKLERLHGFGIALPTSAEIGVGDWISVAQLSEQLGYASVWATEDTGREACVVLGALAARTDRLLIGTAVVNIYSRSARLLAQAAATLDDLSEGRAVLGLGYGNSRTVKKWHSSSMDHASERMRDYIGIIRSHLRGDDNSIGTEVSALGMRPPFGEGEESIPIIVGGSSSGLIDASAELVDGWMPSGPPEFIERHRQRFDKGQVILAYVLTAASEDGNAALDTVRRQIVNYAVTVPYLRRRYEKALGEELIGRISALWKADNRVQALRLVPETYVRSVAIVGTPTECRDRIRDYYDVGANGVLFGLTRFTSLSDLRETIRLLAPESSKGRRTGGRG